MMRINVLTLFPEMFKGVIDGSILGRAAEKDLLRFRILNIRDFTEDKHKKVDDTPYGGGVGMVLFCQPVFQCLRELGLEKRKGSKKQRILYMSPRGKVLNREKIEELAELEEITILCGHYEGVDQRIIEYWDMEEISIGDYVLTGGEIPAMALIDAVSRFIPDVLGKEASAFDESIYSGLLEADQYTKPRIYEGMKVPDVLTSGNHKDIKMWQLENSLRLTGKVRPEFISQWEKSENALKDLTKKEKKWIENILMEL